MNNKETTIQQRLLRKPLHEPKYRNVLALSKKRKLPNPIKLEQPLGIKILRGTQSLSAKKFNLLSNRKQSSACAIVALAYSKIYSIIKWNSLDLDRIIDISDLVYRKSLSLTSKANIIGSSTTLTLNNICNNFFIDNFNVTTVLDYPVDYFEDKIKVSHKISIDQFAKNLNTFIENHENCILYFNKMYFPIWWYRKEKTTIKSKAKDEYYYCFNPFNCNENGQRLIRNNSKGYCYLIKTQTIDKVVQYLLRSIFYQNEINDYRLETIRILKIEEKLKYPTIDETIIINDVDDDGYHKECFDEHLSYKKPTVINLQCDLNVEKCSIERKDFNNLNQEIICEIDDTEDREDNDHNEDDKEFRNVILTQQFPKHHIDFSDDYLKISNTIGILRGGSYVKQANTIPCVNIAAIVMLRIARSFTWTKDTIHEIQSIGKKIYKNNLSNVDDNIILPNDITATIKIGNTKFDIVSDQILFGNLSNAPQNLNNIADLEYGLQEFFKYYDIGILDGPENVAIWQENNLYYMFNGRKCDKYGKKWSNISDRELNNVDDELTYGAACVTWYHNLQDMVNSYMNNISIKHRHESYRLTYIEVNDAIIKSDNWQNWISFGLMKWILRGHFSQNNIKYSIDSRNNQSTAISMIALVYTKLVRIEEWESKNLDDILNIGDCFYHDCVKKLKDSATFNQSHLQINEIMHHYTVKNKCIEFIINDSLVIGSFLSPLSLEEGLRNFFQYNDQGVLTSDHFSLAIWKKSDNFYLFDSYERDDKGKNPLTCPSFYRKNNFEDTCCALRFGTLTDFVDSIIGNVKICDSTAETFKLNNLEIIITDQDERPPLYDYLEFGEDNGILYGNNEFNKELIHKLANQKQQNIICNLIVALCMKQIKKSKKWTKYDFIDIVKIGFEHYCDVLKKFQDYGNKQNEIPPQSIENDIFLKYQVDYFLSDKHLVKIGANQFQIIANEIQQGKFAIKQNSISSKIPDRKSSIIIDTTKQSSHQTINSGKSSILERLSMRRSLNYSDGSNNASRRVNQSFSNLLNTDQSQQDQDQQKLCFNLMQFLEKLKNKDNFNCILESDIITLGIWKQDNLYFVYDPLLCNLECTQLHPKRILQYRERIAHRQVIIDNNKIGQLKQLETIGDGIITSNIEINGNKELSNIIESPHVEELINNKTDKNNTSNVIVSTDVDDDDDHEEIILEENYSPYIAWFPSVSNLVEHIFQFVPKEFENEWFKLYEFQYENKLNCVDDNNFENNNNNIDDDQEELYNFKKINKNYWILRGSMSQNDNIFLKIPNRDNQDLSNDIIALVLSTLCTELNDWNSKILDIILKYGDRLYTASILKHQQQQQQNNDNNVNAQIRNYNLQLNDIIKPFTLANIIIDFKLNTTINGNLTKINKNTENALEEFFNGASEKQEHLGILMAKNYAVAIWLTQKTYFMFDSHEIGPNGLHRKNGVSCLYRFTTIRHLNDIFLRNLDYNTGTNQFELFHITITKSLKPSNIPKNYLQLPITHSAYKNITHQYIKSPYMIDVNVLYGNISNDQSSSTICQAYAALIMNYTNNVDYWTMETIDQIIRLGKQIYKKSVKFIDDENNNNDDDFRNLSPQQITKDFQLNENLIIHSEIQMTYAGIINSYPNQIYHQYDNSDNSSKILTLKNGIGKFFQKYSYGILCINEIELIIALWKENYGYYLFFAKWLNVELINQLEEIPEESNNCACVIKFPDQSKLYDEIILNINKLQSSAINKLENPLFYEIWNCDCTIVDNFGTQNNKMKNLFKDIIIPELRIPASAPKHNNENDVQDNALKIIFEAQQRNHLHSNSNNNNNNS